MDTSHLLGEHEVFRAQMDLEDNMMTLTYYDDGEQGLIGIYNKVFMDVPKSLQKDFKSVQELFTFFKEVETKAIKVVEKRQSQVTVQFNQPQKTHTIKIQGKKHEKNYELLAQFKMQQGVGYERKNRELVEKLKSEKDSHEKVKTELEAIKTELKTAKEEVIKSAKKQYVVPPEEAVPAGSQAYNSGKKDLINKRTSNAGRTGMISFEGDMLGVKGIREFISIDLKQIHTLDLNQNCLTNAGLEVLTRVNWPNLKILNLGQNQLRELTWTVPNVKGVTALGLERNFLTKLPDNFKELESLERLDLHDNELTLIPSVLPTFKQLLFIWIGDNRIPNIENQETFKAVRDKFKGEFLQKAPL